MTIDPKTIRVPDAAMEAAWEIYIREGCGPSAFNAALAAMLAAHTDDKRAHSPFPNSENASRAALVEKVAEAIAVSENFPWDNEDWAEFRNSFRRNAIAVIDLIRSETLEEAARVCAYHWTPKECAAAIRALKEKSNG